MDNLTHTIAGVLIGEGIARFVPAGHSALAPPQRRSLLVVLAAVCRTLPDADLLYTLASGHKLDVVQPAPATAPRLACSIPCWSSSWSTEGSVPPLPSSAPTRARCAMRRV